MFVVSREKGDDANAPSASVSDKKPARYEARMRLTDKPYSSELSDPDSQQYSALKSQFELSVQYAFFKFKFKLAVRAPRLSNYCLLNAHLLTPPSNTGNTKRCMF